MIWSLVLTSGPARLSPGRSRRRFRDVAAGQRFDLALRHLRRIADDAALAAAERNVATAHFHVIHAASAVTSSSVTAG
jgi:hypothetical protein